MTRHLHFGVLSRLQYTIPSAKQYYRLSLDQGETVLAENLWPDKKLTGILDKFLAMEYNARQHLADRGPVLEPSRDYGATCGGVRRGTVSIAAGCASLARLTAKDRPHPWVCGRVARPVVGPAELLC